MKQATIAGAGSDIGRGLRNRLEADGWKVTSADRHESVFGPWDLLVLMQGRLRPVGRFFVADVDSWETCVSANLFAPLRALRNAWDYQNRGATVVFMGGPNLAKPSPTYTAYRAGKSALELIVETIGIEYPETRFRILHPGVVNTKIHDQTLEAGVRAENIERVKRIVSGEEPSVSLDVVYGKLKALM